jgi:hypothetical protein
MPNIGQGINTTQNALSTTAELVLAARRGRAFCEVKNADAAISVYVSGTDAVTSSNGHLLKAGEAIAFENYIGPIYAIAASGTPTVTTIEW